MVCGTVRLVTRNYSCYLQEGRKDQTAMQTIRKDPEWVTLFARSDVHYRVTGMKHARVRRNLLASRDLGGAAFVRSLCREFAGSDGLSSCRRPDPRESNFARLGDPTETMASVSVNRRGACRIGTAHARADAHFLR